MVASTVLASVAASLWSWRNGAMLNYGDAVAHLHIARRVFDSHRPGLSQLGSVWLPLPHLLMLPFVAVYAWWANGIAGMIPSALAYLAGCAGVYRLARHWLRPSAAVVALAFFALNPNLLYLQTTAMTEPLFLCEMIWLAVWLVEWRGASNNDPPRAGADCCAALRWSSLRRFSRAMTAGSWPFLAWTSVGIVLLRHQHPPLAQLSGSRAPPWSRRRSRGSPTTRSSSATGSTSRAAPTPRSHRTAHRDTWIRPAASGLAQSLGLAPVLHEMRRDGRAAAAWGNLTADACPCWALPGRWLHDAQARLLMDAASMAAGSLLRVFSGFWVGADLSSRVVAALLVQHALWNGDAAGIRAGTRLRGAIRDRRGPRIQAETGAVCRRRALRARCRQCMGRSFAIIL